MRSLPTETRGRLLFFAHGMMSAPHGQLPEPGMARHASLDWLNFLLADVRGGLGPYVSVYLLTEARWDPAAIGTVLTLSGLIGISLHVPVGAFIDSTRAKRGLLMAGIVSLSACRRALREPAACHGRPRGPPRWCGAGSAGRRPV